MTLLFIDGFDHYNATPSDPVLITSKWSTYIWAGHQAFGPPMLYTYSTGGRSGAGYLHMGYNDQSGEYYVLGRRLPRILTSVVVGFALRPSTQGGGSGEYVGYDFLTIGWAGTARCTFRVNSEGRVVCQARRPYSTYPDLSGVYFGGTYGGGGETQAPDLGMTAPNMATFNHWNYWEFKVGGGQATVWRDGVLQFTASGDIGTQYDYVYLGKLGGKDAGYANFAVWAYDYDDFYLIDPTDSVMPNDVLGDVNILTIWPRAVGVQSEWTPTPAGDNYQNVNDRPTPDRDSTGNATTDDGKIDTFPMEHVPGGPILGAQYDFTSKNMRSSRFEIAPVTHYDTAQITSNPVRPIADYTIVTSAFGQNPLTEANWTADDFNQPPAEHGYQSVLTP